MRFYLFTTTDTLIVCYALNPSNTRFYIYLIYPTFCCYNKSQKLTDNTLNLDVFKGVTQGTLIWRKLPKPQKRT